MTTGTACGKIILFGEHAVVYGRPALAVPLSQLRAKAFVTRRAQEGIVIHARDLEREIVVNDASASEPLAAITRMTLERLGLYENLDISVESDLPLAGGLGSGAAISTALVRALAAHFDQALTPAQISALVYETEKMYHGTPSGIDNTVIAYEQPVRFDRPKPSAQTSVGQTTLGWEITPFRIARPFTLAIANTGVTSPTKITVGDVRRGWEQDPVRYEKTFDTIGEIVQRAQDAVARSENEALGKLMTRNQDALRELGVSSPEVERLLDAGLHAGAAGGKLSGGGGGGNVIFYMGEGRADMVKRALLDAGAVSVIVTKIGT